MGNELTWGMLVILYLSRSVPAVGGLSGCSAASRTLTLADVEFFRRN